MLCDPDDPLRHAALPRPLLDLLVCIALSAIVVDDGAGVRERPPQDNGQQHAITFF